MCNNIEVFKRWGDVGMRGVENIKLRGRVVNGENE